MSTQKKKGQKHQNKTAFKIKYDTQAIEIVKKVPLDHLCKRCLEQIQWKLKFNKYKPAKSVSRCNRCGDKTVIKAYRKCCDLCSNKFGICTKCEQNKNLEPEPVKISEDEKKNNGVDKKLLAIMEDYLEKLRERSRRMILRKIKADLLTWKDGQFVYKEDGKPLENLKFKKEEDDIDDFEDSSEEEKEEKKPKKPAKANKKPENQPDEDGFEDISDDDDEDEEEEEKI